MPTVGQPSDTTVWRNATELRRKMATTTQLFPLPRVIFTTSTYGNENDALKAPESLYLISQDGARTLYLVNHFDVVFVFLTVHNSFYEKFAKSKM